MAGRARLRFDCNVSTSRKFGGKGTRKVTRSLVLGTCAQSVSQSVLQDPLAANFENGQYYDDTLVSDLEDVVFFVKPETLRPLANIIDRCIRSVFLRLEGNMFEVSENSDFASEMYKEVPVEGCLLPNSEASYITVFLRRMDLCSVGRLICFLAEEGLCFVQRCIYLDAATPSEALLEVASKLTSTARRYRDDSYRQFGIDCYKRALSYEPNTSHVLGKVICPRAAENTTVTTSTDIGLQGVYIFCGVVTAAGLFQLALSFCGPWLRKFKTMWLESTGEAPNNISTDTLKNESSEVLISEASPESTVLVNAEAYEGVKDSPQDSLQDTPRGSIYESARNSVYTGSENSLYGSARGIVQ